MGQRGEITSYTGHRSVEEIFSRKLNTLCTRLRMVVHDSVYVVGQEQQCAQCACRIMRRQCGDRQGQCIRCERFPRWQDKTSQAVELLLSEYPCVEQYTLVWQPPRPEKTRLTTESVAFGARIEEARQARGWSQEELAAKVIKKNGGHLSSTTIRMYERGQQNPSQFVKGQLEKILG